LNSIIAFSSILLRKQQKALTEESAGSMEMTQIERILNNGRQLLRLINNTSEVAKKESEALTLKPASIQVNELIKTVLDAFEPTAQAKAIALQMDCDRAPSQVTTDTLRLQQILTNLVSNAIRYSDNGSITVTCYTLDAPTNNQKDAQADRGQWAIAVKDTGRGISADDQLKIFEPYFRVNNTDEIVPESSGLGLAIVSKLVRLLQGRLELTSAVGEGSTFRVCLPLTLKQIENQIEN
ncbi:MAG: HAMP domain-containing sensor histidine kinase, partial [Cyanobacteria bacterium J06598_3]